MSPSEFGNGAKSSPGRLIGTCHLIRTVAFLARAFALTLKDPIRRALKKLYGATLISIMLKKLGNAYSSITFSIQVVLFSSSEHIAKRGQKHVKHRSTEAHELAQTLPGACKHDVGGIESPRSRKSSHARFSSCVAKKMVCP